MDDKMYSAGGMKNCESGQGSPAKKDASIRSAPSSVDLHKNPMITPAVPAVGKMGNVK